MDFFPPVIHGTLREHYLLLFGAAGTFALITGLLGAWIGSYFGGRAGARRAIARIEQAPNAALEVQLGDLRRAVDTVALEMERISEGQRFTARMLVERGAPPSSVNHLREAGPTTPH